MRKSDERLFQEFATLPMVVELFGSTRPCDPALGARVREGLELLFLDLGKPKRAAWERVVFPAQRGRAVERTFADVATGEAEVVLLAEGLQPALMGSLRAGSSIAGCQHDWCLVAPDLRFAFILSHEGDHVYVEASEPELELLPWNRGAR